MSPAHSHPHAYTDACGDAAAYPHTGGDAATDSHAVPYGHTSSHSAAHGNADIQAYAYTHPYPCDDPETYPHADRDTSAFTHAYAYSGRDSVSSGYPGDNDMPAGHSCDDAVRYVSACCHGDTAASNATRNSNAEDGDCQPERSEHVLQHQHAVCSGRGAGDD